MMAMQLKGLKTILVAALFVLCGCSAAMDLAVTGAGKSAQIENINFFNTTSDLQPNNKSVPDLPDYYYISPSFALSKYRKVIINDFTSITSNVNKISGLQISQLKNLRKDIPDNISQSFDGSVFSQCTRSSQRIDHSDINDIKRGSSPK
jgi:hypothetical protein